MQPSPQTYSSVAGESVEITITVRDSSGAVVDITNATPHFAMAYRPGGDAVVGTELSPANASAALLVPAAGTMKVTLDKAVTETLLGSYYADAWVDDASLNRVAAARLYWTFGASARL
jgi:hypothetical protein